MRPSALNNRVGITIGQTYLGTRLDGWEQPAVTPAQRKGRCYELCALAVALAPSDTSLVLVHGTIHGPEADMERIGHAWVLMPDGRVWEPYQRNIYISEANWTEYASAEIERKYGRAAAWKKMQRTDNFGPWHETKGRTN